MLAKILGKERFFIMRSPDGNALPIKALSLLALLSVSSTYNLKVTRVKYASSPSPSRLDIIFDLKLV